MAYSAPAGYTGPRSASSADAGAVHAHSILHFTYFLIPVIAGVDKFFDRLTDWDKYLAPVVASTAHMEPHRLLMFVGGVEILAGLIVAIRPRIGAFLVAIWLACIIVNLALNPNHYWDVAARDFGLLLGALALGSLSGWAARRT